MHINRSEAGEIEGSRHFDMTVHALFTQDGHARTHAAGNERRSDVVVEVIAELDAQACIFRSSRLCQRRKLFLGAIGVVAQRLNAIAGLGPALLSLGASQREQLGAGLDEVQRIIATECADGVDMTGQRGAGKRGLHGTGIGTAHLHDSAQLFAEQRRQRVIP